MESRRSNIFEEMIQLGLLCSGKLYNNGLSFKIWESRLIVRQRRFNKNVYTQLRNSNGIQTLDMATAERF